MSGSNEKTNTPGIKRIDIVLGLICAIFFIDTVSPVAQMGPAAITWMIIMAVLFFFPGSLTVAELGSAYPENGGFYAWIKRAYGKAWGARITWMYWSCNAIWISSVATFTSTVFCQLFIPNVSMVVQSIMNLALIWLMVFVASRPLKNSTFFINASAVIKLGMAAGLVVAAFSVLSKNGFVPANSISWADFKPTYGQTLYFLPALIYNFLGFESMSAATAEMKNPAKDVPKSALNNVLIVTVLYIVAVLAMLTIQPVENISIVKGVMDAFMIGLGSSPIMKFVVYTIGLLFVLVLFTQGMLWILTVCRVSAETALHYELPMAFAKMHPKNNTPIGSLILAGIVATVVNVIYGFMSSSAEEMFWTIFSCTSIILLLPYLINFEAFLKLRKEDTTTKRPYTFPGPKGLVSFFIRIAQIIILLCILFFVWVPGEPFNMKLGLSVIIGVIVTLGAGEIITRTSMARAPGNKKAAEKLGGVENIGATETL
ncbi:APC family permease [Phosphitispora sp. TUW77]|uniref:APC family permease n=1 Tax=Phosphitispora sp. TUW77 TaxID=3152361 RepID=UPI003AB1C5ED